MNRNWPIVLGLAGLSAGSLLGACGPGTSSSSTTTSSSGDTSSTGMDSSSSTGAGGDGTGGNGTGGNGTGGNGTGGGMCKPPTKLHPPMPPPNTIYCPFSATDGGANEFCNPEVEHCCVTPAMSPLPSSCTPSGTPCGAGDIDWQCQDPADCAGKVCCGAGTLMINPNPMCANTVSGFTGTHCADSCTAGEIVMCTSDGECQQGQKCNPFGVRGAQVGGCQ